MGKKRAENLDSEKVKRLREGIEKGELSRERIELAAYMGDTEAASVTGVRANRRRGLRAWLNAAPGATPPESAAPATDPQATRVAYLQRLSSETCGMDPELTDQIAAAIAEPTTLALSNLAQRVSSKAVSETFPRAIEVMHELIALTSDTMETCVSPVAPLSEIHYRAGIAAVRRLLGTPGSDLSQRLERHLAALSAAPHQMAWWLRDLEEDVEAELRLAAAEALLLGHSSSLIVEAFREVKDRTDAGHRGWRGAVAIHAALWGESDPVADRVSAVLHATATAQQ